MIRLPPIDKYRQPFIEPLGCLTLLAARAENELIDLIALSRASPDRIETDLSVEAEQASCELRRWDKARSQAIASEMSASVRDATLQQKLCKGLEDFTNLRDRRNRAIHDAIEVGFDDDDGAVSLAVRYLPKGKGIQKQHIAAITPEDIGVLACDFHELRGDLSFLVWSLKKYRSGTD